MKDLILHLLRHPAILTDTSLHKLYPFRTMETFKVSPWDMRELPEALRKQYTDSEGYADIRCRCGERFEPNIGGYFSAWVVVYSSDDMELACSRSCLPAGTMEFHYQKYGYRQPIQFPPNFEESVLHRMIWRVLHNTSNRYRLRAYREVTADQLREFDLWTEGAGGTFDELGWRFYDQRGFKFTASNYREGQSVSFSEAKALAALNEILAWNYDQQPKAPNVGDQLSLF